MSKLNGICAAFFLSFSSIAAYAQSGVINMPSIAATEVHLVNEGNHDLQFLLRPKDGAWQEFTIGSGKSETYECEKCSEMEFLMRTGENRVHYILQSQERYVLRWNTGKSLWDLFRVTK